MSNPYPYQYNNAYPSAVASFVYGGDAAFSGLIGDFPIVVGISSRPPEVLPDPDPPPPAVHGGTRDANAKASPPVEPKKRATKANAKASPPVEPKKRATKAKATAAPLVEPAKRKTKGR